MLASDSTATVQSFTGQTLLVKDYFVSVLGAPALNMGVFVGIISGFLGQLYIISTIIIINYLMH